MAYQNVGTPRFYVSILQWLKSLGQLYTWGTSDSSNLTDEGQLLAVDINPTIYQIFNDPADGNVRGTNYRSLAGNYDDLMPAKKNFFMILGHTLSGVHCSAVEGGTGNTHLGDNELVNYTSRIPSQNGFSIGIENNADDCQENYIHIRFSQYTADTDYKVGSYLYGTYYDMPHSPDLKLTMTREMDGVKRIRTKGGADLVNRRYIKPAMWLDDAGAWELYEGIPTNQELSRSGRRVWDLSFSYLQDSDIFPEISNLNWYEAYDNGTQYTESEADDKTLLKDDTFYSQVIHKTNGGQLPFVFQPDNANNNIDGFAIAKLDMNSFKFSQVTNTIYNIKLKIREVW